MADNRSQQKTLIGEITSEVTPAASPLLEFLLASSRKIAVIAVICVLIGVGYGIFNWHSKKQAAAAQANLGHILVTQKPADRLAKLQALLPEAPEAVKGAVRLAIAKAAAEAHEYAVMYAAWDALGGNADGTLKTAAMIGKASALDLQGKTKEALALAESISLPADSAFLPLVHGMVVDLAEKSGDFPKAVAACEKLAATVAVFNPEEADFWRQKAAFLRDQEKAAKS